MTAETTTTMTPVSVTMPVAFTPEWSRIDGITVDGPTITLDPARYFFRYENPSWVLVDWDLVRRELLEHPQESTGQALEQRALDFVREHGRVTNSPADVLTTAYNVAEFLYRDIDIPGMDVTDQQLTALREATTLMALNRVELSGHMSNVGPCWFFPVATSVVFDFSQDEGEQLDEIYHGGWFNENRRRDAVLAHVALGGRLVHGCQASADMSGGCVLAYGTDLDGFRSELNGLKGDWIDRVDSMRP